MPITFWNDHSAEFGGPPDAAALRERYVADGRAVADDLARDGNVLAIWLSGPFEIPRIYPASDLHMAVLLERAEHTVYRHVIPEFSAVGRRLEIACLPLRYLRTALEGGCADWPTFFDIHKLSDILILYEREGILSGMRKRFADLRPGRLFIGGEIRALSSELRGTERLLDERRHEECILSARDVLWHSTQLLLLAGGGLTFSKVSHLYPKLKSFVAPSELRTFERVQAIDGLDETDARRLATKAADFVKCLFERHGL